MADLFYVREANVHENDRIHAFMDEAQASRWVSRRCYLTPGEVIAMWRTEGMVEDAGLTNWTVNGPPSVDRFHLDEDI